MSAQFQPRLISEEVHLLEQARSGCTRSLNQLVASYERLARRMASRFFLPGGDRQDILQEALLGLAVAIKNYNPSYQKEFNEYAVLCIRNSLVRAVRGATRKKHQLLNQAGELEEGSMLRSRNTDLENVVENREVLKHIWKGLCDSLSELEIEVLKQRLAGKTSEEIAASTGLSLKQIENGLFRARKKARSLLADMERPTHKTGQKAA